MLRGQVDQAVRQIRIKQMIENGRRYFEATEYPLALRKVQEALELDPNEATALSLKAQIEKERREKKISEWITLAHQHLENQAFRQAREALDNVLQIKPNETEALRLAAEVGRREQEVSRAREEKAKLYQSAMQAWEKGEVTSALTKLEVLLAMDRDQPETDSNRSGGYQSFYNKVHSEHNAQKNAYEEARRNLAADNFEGALAISRQYLTKYPNHALFQSLQFDIEERQRQALSAVIAETDRRVDEEPDLDRRLGILENVLKLYPGETHFMRTMQLVRDKRDLVSSIVGKARYFEERGQFLEALDQWQILKSIHEKQPGLAFDIERLIKRRDQQARQNSKARWVEQTDKYLEGGDYDRATKTIQNALMEFPGEPELLELDKLVRKNQERSKQALELLDRAREQSEKGSSDAALDLLRQAHELDARNTVIRTVLMNTLFEQARRSIDSNPDAADAAVQEILELEPSNGPARSLASQISDRKQEDFITWCLSQARRLQTDGDLSGALAIAAQGLSTYPNEVRLQQLKATLERAQQEAQRQVRTPRPTTATQVNVIPAPPVEAPAPAPVSEIIPPPQAVQPTYEQSGIELSELMAPDAAPPEPQPQTGPIKPPNRNFLYAGSAVAGLALLLIGIGLYEHFKAKPAPPPPPPVAAKIRVTIHATPAGAEISVNGTPCGTSNCGLDLAPGQYRAEAKLADYQPAATTFSITEGQSAPSEISLLLTPPPPLVSISTDLPDGVVLLDQAKIAQLQGSDVEIKTLPDGQHILFVQNGTFRSSFTVDIASGAMPKLTGAIKTQGMHGFVLVRRPDAKVYASDAGSKATLDGKPAQAIDANGLELRDVTPGSHDLQLEAPAAHARISFTASPAAAIQASLTTDQNLSVLNIVTNEDDAQVFLNNDPYRRVAKNGRVRIYLPAKKYTVRVQKEGYASPPEQVVDLRNGQESQLDFQLASQKGTLAVHRGLAGAEIFLDGKRLGIVRADGEFSAAYIDPGRHNVQIRRDRYRTIQSDLTFVTGKTIELDASMQSVYGTLKIEVSPQVADARVHFRRQGDTLDHETKETILSVQEGTYTVSASAPKYQDASVTVHVTADGSSVATLVMRPEPAPVAKVTPAPKPAQLTFALNDWLKLGWNRDGSSITHQGGDFVLAPLPLTAGSIQFTVVSIHGKRIEWVTSYRDGKNYYLFQMDDLTFSRTEVQDGKHSKTVRIQRDFKRDQYNTFEIEITATGVATSVLRGGQMQPVNTRSRGGPAPGKFGFHIPGRDEIGLSDFRLTQK